jgi:hypothetical protein
VKNSLHRNIFRFLLLASILAIIFSFQSPNVALADTDSGTGPGGVGSTDGSSNLVLWLDAGSLSTSPVSLWVDQSGNGNDASQGTVTNQPAWVSNQLNDQPVLRFDGSNHFMAVDDDPSLDGTSGLTILSVIKPDAVGNNYQSFLSKRDDYNTEASYTLLFYDASTFLYVDIDSSNDRFNSTTTYGNVPTVVEVVYDGSLSSADQRAKVYDKGTFIINSAETSTTIPDYASNLYIGEMHAEGGPTPLYPFDGDIAEVIIYDKALNTAERILAENYLGAKYEIAVANDYYDGDIPDGNGIDFDLNVAGIGMEDGSSLAAYSAGMKISDSSFLQDNGDYLLFGHNTLSNDNTQSDLPWDLGTYPNAQRWTRHWYIDVTDVSGNGGTVDITFDFSDAGMNGDANKLPKGDLANYKLLGRSTTNSDFSVVVATASSISGDQVIFSNVPVNSLGSNFTLGTLDSISSPSAIDLILLDANSLPTTINLVVATILLIAILFLIFILKKRALFSH